MSLNCPRVLPLFRNALRLNNKCTFHLQNLSFHIPPKYVLGSNIIHNMRKLSTSKVHLDETDETEDMVTFYFVTHKGEEIEIKGHCGHTIMQAGKDFDALPYASCNGVPACKGCHLQMDDEMTKLFPPMTETERSVLKTSKHVKSNSRLSCQLFITKLIEGAKFILPKPENKK